MADNIVEAPIQVTEPVVDTNKVELDRQMAIALGTPQAQPEIENVERGTSSSEPVITSTEPIAVPEFKFETLKEKFGYEKPEDAITEIEQLRHLKANPTPAELKFENESSEKIFKLLAAGKQKEVLSYLADQERYESLSSLEVNDSSAEDIIKAGMQLKYKGLTTDMINHRFNKTFGLPKEPVIRGDEDQEDFDQRKADWTEQVKEIKMERVIEANLVKPEIEAAKSKLVIPEIPQNVDQEYLNYKKEKETIATSNAEVFEAYKVFKQDDVKFEQDFNDEANKIAFKMEYTPSAEAFKKAQDCVTDLDKFFAMYQNSDGSPNRKAFISDFAFIIDKKAFIAEAMKQAKNATIKAQLPDNNAESGIVRQLVTNAGEESELDRQMRLAGVKRI